MYRGIKGGLYVLLASGKKKYVKSVANPIAKLASPKKPKMPPPPPPPLPPKPKAGLPAVLNPVVNANPQKYPKRAVAIRRAQMWTGNAYKNVCAVLSGKREYAGSVRKAERIIKGLQAYMKHSAPRVPEIPRGFKVPEALYRGVGSGKVPAVGDTVPAGRKGCFASFTRDLNTAFFFADRANAGYVFRLQLDRIARGTPWIWYDDTDKAPVRNRMQPPSGFGDEFEVLMPPGNLKIVRKSKLRKMTILDVAFAPHADYLRRGALPKQQDKTLVFKTTGGNRLEITATNARTALLKRTFQRVARQGLPPKN